MIRFIFRVWAVITVAVKRLAAQRWLALAVFLGLVVSISLMISIPTYAEGIYHRVFLSKLQADPSLSLRDYPAFSYMVRYIGGTFGAMSWEDVVPADAYVRGDGLKTLGLPVRYVVRHFRTDNFHLLSAKGDEDKYDSQNPLTWVSFGVVTGIQEHVQVVEGSFPSPPAAHSAAAGGDGEIEVVISDHVANELGLQVGEVYRVFMDTRAMGGADGGELIDLPIRITGIWVPIDPEEDFWFLNPKSIAGVLLVSEEVFVGRICSELKYDVSLAVWYLVFDGSAVRTDDVNSLLSRTNRFRQRVTTLLPNSRLDLSPGEALQTYRSAVGVLTTLLYAFSVPIIGLILAFVGLVAGLEVEQRQNEIAVLRSRGAAASQVAGIALAGGALLAVVALFLGVFGGDAIAQMIGRVRGFLDFSAPAEFEIRSTATSIRFGLVAVAVALVAQVVPTLAATRHTVVSYKRQRARSLGRPWWQRAWLDVMLMIPAAYGAYQLRVRGGLIFAREGVAVGDPFSDPLLFLVPSLGILAVSLLVLRVLPYVMSVIAWVAGYLPDVGAVLAARHLSRSPRFYSAPLLLLMITLSLSTFTASLAQTLDKHLHDQTYYRVGAEMRVVESGESTGSSGLGGVTGASASDSGPRWYFLPVSEHLRAADVEVASRVGRFTAFHKVTGNLQNGTFLGVDRSNFADVAFWREDFSTQSLGGMMNQLAKQRNGVLVPRSFMAAYTYSLGDRVPVSVDVLAHRVSLQMQIVGSFELFPTWYPHDEQQGILFVGNLDYLFEESGGQLPYDVWLDVRPGADYVRIEEELEETGIRVQRWLAPEVLIAAEQERPERQGLFGVLSVGFVAAALLTALGFLLYAFFSFKRRFIEFGVLRAIGLSSRQMISFLGWELAFLIGVGLGVGTGLGVWMSYLFIPYLQIGPGASARIPPYVVDIDWPNVFRIYILFGALFVVALGILVALLLRIKIFQAVKLGESA